MIVRRHKLDLMIYQGTEKDHEFIKNLGGVHYEKTQFSGEHYVLAYSEDMVRRLKDKGAELERELSELVKPGKNWEEVKSLTLPSKRKQMEHQRKASALLLNQKRFMLALDMGLGKTKCAVDAMVELFKEGKATRALVITEASMIDNWSNHMIAEDSDLKGISLNGSKKDRRAKLRYGIAKGYQVFCINHDGVPVILDDLLDCCEEDWILIIDESSRIKDHTTRRFKTLWKLFQEISFEYVWLLTGTPLTQKPEDIFSQYCLIDTDEFGPPKKFYAFKATYTIGSGGPHNKVEAYKNMEMYMRKLHGHCYRLLKDDVLDLPPRTYQVIKLQLPKKLKAVYEEFVKTTGLIRVKNHPKAEPNTDGVLFEAEHPFSLRMKARQLVNNWMYRDIYGEDYETVVDRDTIRLFPDTENPKIGFIDSVLTEKPDWQWVIWFAFKADKLEIIEYLEKNGVEFSVIDGDTPKPARTEIERQFQNGHMRVLVAQPSAAGYGLNFTPKMFSRYTKQGVIYYTNGDKCGDRKQSEDRTYRIGTKDNVHYYDLIYEGTIEATIYQSLQRKIDFNTILSSKTTLDDPRLLEMLRGTLKI